MVLRFTLSGICLLLAGVMVFCMAFCVVISPSVLAVKDNSQSFVIVMYHHISENPSLIGEYVISAKKLEEDFKYLKKCGYKTLTVSDLYEINNGKKALPEKSIMLTFDDGQESFYKYAYPLLEKYGFSAVFSVIGAYTEQFSKMQKQEAEYSHITWKQIKEMTAGGRVEIGNHSYNMHFNNGTGRSGVTQMSGENNNDYRTALEEDILTFNSMFLKNVGYIPEIYTYPFGRFSNLTEDIIKKCGFSAVFTCHEKRIVPNSSEDWLYKLGRYNRSGKENTESFFKKLSVY